MQRGKYIASSNLFFSSRNKHRFSIIHVTQDKLCEFLYQSSTLKNTSFLSTVAILLYKISYLYTSSWFSLQVLVAIEEIVNLTKPAFFLTRFCFVLMGKEYSTALDWMCIIQFSIFERKHCQEGYNLFPSAMCFIFSDNCRLNFIQRW